MYLGKAHILSAIAFLNKNIKGVLLYTNPSFKLEQNNSGRANCNQSSPTLQKTKRNLDTCKEKASSRACELYLCATVTPKRYRAWLARSHQWTRASHTMVQLSIAPSQHTYKPISPEPRAQIPHAFPVNAWQMIVWWRQTSQTIPPYYPAKTVLSVAANVIGILTFAAGIIADFILNPRAVARSVADLILLEEEYDSAYRQLRQLGPRLESLDRYSSAVVFKHDRSHLGALEDLLKRYRRPVQSAGEKFWEDQR